MKSLTVVAICLVACSLGAGDVHADDSEAARQVELAREDLDAGQYERAISACDSALRLDPAEQEAFKIKGLALEQLGQTDDARGMLLAYKSLRSGLPDDPEVEAALERMARPAEPPPKEPRTRPERQPRAKPAPPSQAILLPILVMVAGGGVATAGFTLHGVSYERASPDLDLEHGLYFGSRAGYEPLYDQNKLGFEIGLGGAAVAGVGVVLTIVAISREPRATSYRGPIPWTVAGPGGVMIGFAGELP